MSTLNLNPERTALVCIDFQAGVFTGNCTLSYVGTEAVLVKAKQVLAAARQGKLPIIHVQEVHRQQLVDFGRELEGAEPIHCLETWDSTNYHPELAPIEGEFTITKRRYSSFFGTDLDILLRGLKVDTLVLMGTITNVCVHYTAIDAHQRDYYFHVVEDCCAGSDWDAHWAALNAMAYLQKKARIDHHQFIDAVNRMVQEPAMCSS